MAAGKYNLFVEQGATFRRLLTLKDSAGIINLTGYTVRSQIRSEPGSPTLIHDMTPDLVVVPVAGTIELVIPSADTTGFTWKRAAWDLEIVEPGGDVIRVLKGTVVNDLEVTV